MRNVASSSPVPRPGPFRPRPRPRRSRSPSPNTPQADSEGQPDPQQDPRSTGSVGRSSAPLSEKLNQTDGIIRPPAKIAPEMAVRPPDPGTTRVIPPPPPPAGPRLSSLSEASRPMSDLTDRGPVDHIVELAHEIMEQCPARAAQASEITTWATEIRERRPSRTEIDALVDATYGGFLPHERRARLIEGLRAPCASNAASQRLFYYRPSTLQGQPVERQLAARLSLVYLP